MSFTNKALFASLPRTQRGQPLVLGGDPKGKNFLYTHGNSVIIRNIENPEIAETYTEHSCQVNVAKYSPSGFYIASADQSGKVRIWDTVNKEHICKIELQPFAGPIKDLAWSPDNQRMVVVGEGRECFGHVFLVDTGTSNGTIGGPSKPINSCDFRPARPFKIIAGSEDNSVTVFEGPPFKWKMTKTEHQRYVQSVRYSPNGDHFATGGFDGKIFIYDGKTSDLIGELGSPAHSGGVYAVAWSPDSKSLLSASGDKTCKTWDVATMSLITEFPMGTAIEDQQVSCLWQGKHMLSVSLAGHISYLDPANPSKPLRVIKGHNKPITVMTVNKNRDTVFTGSHDGTITSWDVATGESHRIGGVGHGNQMNGMVTLGESIFTCGIDNAIKEVNMMTKSFTSTNVKLASQPRGLAGDGTTLIVPCEKEIAVIQDGRQVSSISVNFEPSCASMNGHHPDVAIGGTTDHKVHVYILHDGNLTPRMELDHSGPITDCAFSPDNQYLAVADANRLVTLYRLPGFEVASKEVWGFHTAKVNCVAWSPDSTLVASGSLDTSIIVWSVEKPAKRIIIKNAHPQSQITGIAWLDNNTIVSVGQDCNTRYWDIRNFP
ncbi:LOW QUALITY PROTEIN: actin-interacting protein 1-like [Daphnia carinata]|uniref:LOW QUALITY PROTEIN: actin-interacting protein 1-like n=1 Tax=Daphnia carinata TaxID=120202 RepID=UPI00257C9520|nr:LOW QUALITY PROTEIN: actin-interacting protein 1-like [Daphnia carinata]